MMRSQGNTAAEMSSPEAINDTTSTPSAGSASLAICR
jgi:hypothetical protein